MVKWPVNSAVERYWRKNQTWFAATVIKERRVTVGSKQERQVCVHFLNEKTPRNDAWLPVRTKDLRERKEYLESFSSLEGHVSDDMWDVERIIDERGSGKNKLYLVRWAGYGPEYNSWLPTRDVEWSLIDAWEAKKVADVEAAARFSDEERVYSKAHGRAIIEHVALLLIDKLRRTHGKAKRKAIVKWRPCDAWFFDALYEYLIDGIPADEIDDYVSRPRQKVGASGTTAVVAWEFHVRDHSILTKLFASEPEEPRRLAYVRLRDVMPATAIGFMTPMTFSHRGPRDDAKRHTLTVTAGFGALADRNGGAAPDWHFDDAEKDENKDAAAAFICQALQDLHAREGVVSAQMRAECELQLLP